MKPQRLEALLIDADIDPRVEPLLRGVGFRTRSVHRVKVDITDDADIVRWARKHGYIVLCHDRHKDHPTRLAVYSEIALHGGKVVSVGSGKDRNPHTTAGLVLARRAEWRAWFDEFEHGAIHVHSTGMTKYTQQQLGEMAPNVLSLDETAGQEQRIRTRRNPNTRKRKQPHRASAPLPEGPISK